MKKSKKIMSILLAVLLAVGLAACGQSSGSSTTPPATQSTTSSSTTTTETAAEPAETSSEPVTLRVMQWELGNQQMDWANLWYYQELEKDTGVKIIWEPVKEDDFKTKYNLMMASGTYPDVIVRANIGDINVEEYGVTQGILLPLDDYLESNMPNYYSRLFLNNANASIPASDGKTYYIGNLTAQNINHDANHYINKDWLDKLGMDIPTTINELTDVLRAFRDQNPGGADTVLPFSGGDLIHQTQGIYPHFANFGVPLQRWVYGSIVNDKVVFPGYMEGFRAACEWLHLCYEENLLDKEALTQDSNVWSTKMNAGQVGYTAYLRLINTALDPETAAKFVSILPPASEYGVSVPRILEVPQFGAALTISNKHIEETLRWLDAQMETERMMVSVNGPIHEGGPIEPTMTINDNGKYEIKYIPEDNGLYKYVPVAQGQFFAPGDYYFDIYEMPPHRVERYESSKAYADAGVLEDTSYYYLYQLVKMNSDDSMEVDRLFGQIETFMKEYITDFIVRGVTDESWDNFLRSAQSVGVERYLEIYQNAYDSYLAANR